VGETALIAPWDKPKSEKGTAAAGMERGTEMRKRWGLQKVKRKAPCLCWPEIGNKEKTNFFCVTNQGGSQALRQKKLAIIWVIQRKKGQSAEGRAKKVRNKRLAVSEEKCILEDERNPRSSGINR